MFLERLDPSGYYPHHYPPQTVPLTCKPGALNLNLKVTRKTVRLQRQHKATNVTKHHHEPEKEPEPEPEKEPEKEHEHANLLLPHNHKKC